MVNLLLTYIKLEKKFTNSEARLSAIEKKSLCWSSLWARILNVQDIIKGEPRDKIKYIFDVYSFHTIAGAGQHSFNTCLRNVQKMLAYPPNSGSMLGQHCSPLLVQCRSIVHDAGPTLIYHRVCCILCANTWHTTNAVSMLTHSFRSWPVIETAFRECTVFSDCWWRFNIPSPETPDNTIHWPNADVMLATVCDAGPTLFQPKPFKLLTTNIIVTFFSVFWTLVKEKST